MIPKGLKVGDTFTDYNITYKVLKVVGDRYESQAVKIDSVGFLNGEIKESPKETKPILDSVSDVKEDKEDYLSLPYAQLKKLCAQKGLDATGSKSDLIARLEG